MADPATRTEYATVIHTVDYKDFVEGGELGEGGEARVSFGTFPRFGKVALKEGKTVSAEDMKEVELLIKHCNHTNIVRVIGLVRISPTRFIGYFMEYLERGNLSSVIHNPNKNYSWKEINAWTEGIACGLAHLHREEIIHRDIKPTNLLLASRTHVKIADLGISRKDTKTRVTRTSNIGTTAYMSPELMIERTHSYPVDIYSFAITLWEIIHRQKPFEHLGKLEEYELQNQILSGVRPLIDENIDSQIVGLLTRGWHQDAAQRPDLEEFRATMGQMRQNPLHLLEQIGHCRQYDNVDNSDSETSEIGERVECLAVVEDAKTETVLILGGCINSNGRDGYTNSVYMLNLSRDAWTIMCPSLPRPAGRHGAVYLNGYIYFFAGSEGSRNSWTYKLEEGPKWKRVDDMNCQRNFLTNSYTTFNDSIWVTSPEPPIWTTLSAEPVRRVSMESYDPRMDCWHNDGPDRMDGFGELSGLVVVDGKLFTCGSDGVLFYEQHNRTWKEFCPMFSSSAHNPKKEKLDDFSLVTDGSSLIVLGGCYGYDGAPVAEVWKMNVRDPRRKWLQLPPMNIARASFSAFFLDGKLYVVGGHNGSNCISSTEVFDGKEWTYGTNLPAALKYTAAIVIPHDAAERGPFPKEREYRTLGSYRAAAKSDAKSS